MSDQDRLLEILNAHGQDFLASFSLSSTKRKAPQQSPRPTKLQKLDVAEDDEEEWAGIEEEGSSEFEHEDDEFTSAAPDNHVIVFTGPTTSTQPFSASQKKAFLSSKVSRLREDAPAVRPAQSSAEDEEDKTNAQNDALLHRLVHTKLLSGSLNEELDMTPAQRKKALAGRVMELAGNAKLGKGEKRVREAERNKASKRVREGLVRKQKETQSKQLEEAKNLGNYHQSIKNVFEDDSKAPKKTRERGLRMGVGKFSGGILKLGKDDISRVQSGGHSGGTRGRGRGRGGQSRGRR
ncbi:hypothetical protein MKEN_00078600 [Mycena kentingensis (nom. inval.)]|nr:hypothetical protein MKEN_00078600 [Mycena kentingensis (nom. inval.)]